GLAAFHPQPHRMQSLGTLGKAHVINDSKATNAHAAEAALAGMAEGRVARIVGGLAKGAAFDDLVQRSVRNLRASVRIGVDADPFAGAIARHAPEIPTEIIVPGDDEIMIAALNAALNRAEPGDTVLLAPAGASMDQFTSYEARGDALAAAVDRIREEK